MKTEAKSRSRRINNFTKMIAEESRDGDIQTKTTQACNLLLFPAFRQKPEQNFASVSVFVPEEPDSAARLARLLRCPELHSALWSCQFRADGWPDTLLPVLQTVADELGFSCDGLATYMSYARPPGQPEISSPSR